MTLIKGVVYPAWIALSRAAHVPLLLGQHLLYIAACWLFVRRPAPIGPPALVAGGGLCRPAFQPRHVAQCARGTRRYYLAFTLMVLPAARG
jgi:hypothetical protein